MMTAAIIFSIYMMINLLMAIVVDQAWVKEGNGEVNQYGVNRNKLFATMIFFGTIVAIFAFFLPSDDK